MAYIIDVGSGTTKPNASRLFIQTLSPDALGEQFMKQTDGLWKSRAQRFMQAGGHQNDDQRFQGVRCTVLRSRAVVNGVTGYSDDEYDRIIGILDEAFVYLLKSRTVTLSEYQIELFIDTAPGSSGYVIRDSHRSRNRVSVFLGSDVWAIGGTSTQMVPNYYFRYLAQPSVDDQHRAKKRSLTAVFHEFGHIFHQLVSPSHYFALGQLSILQGKSQGELAESPGWRLFPDRPSVAYMKEFHEGVKMYVKDHVSGYASDREPEVVAEMFGGMMMGISFERGAKELYEAFGGVEPEDAMRYASNILRLERIKAAPV